MLTTIWLPREVLENMALIATAAADDETGGMLIGYEGVNRSDDIVVTGLIGAGPRAEHREYGFNPDGRWQRRQLARLYVESGRIATFLGDWHSHPHGLPMPSETDIETAARTAANPRARAPRPLTVIIGRDEGDWMAAGFRYVDGDLAPARLRVFDAEPDELLLALEPRRVLKAKWPGRRRGHLRGRTK
jgi:integrative and conjugative element protein (TIGR02256 family)